MPSQQLPRMTGLTVAGTWRKYWDADIAVEEEMEKIVFQVTSSNEDTDTATEGSDYSDTESADEECLC